MKVSPARIELEVARAAVERGARTRFTFPVTGASMTPALTGGMRVTVETAPPESLAPGELVCWFDPSRGPDHKVVHRLVGTARGDGGRLLLVTRGDASAVEDPPVPADCVIGRVVEVRPPGLIYRVRRLAGGLVRAALGLARRAFRRA